jgi:hypothetical protein
VWTRAEPQDPLRSQTGASNICKDRVSLAYLLLPATQTQQTAPTRTILCHFTNGKLLQPLTQPPSHQCCQTSMKRKCTSHAGGSRKKAHLVDQSASATPAAIEQPVLQRFYPRLLTLRHYLLSVLPKSSRNRRRKLAHLGRPIASNEATATCEPDFELGQLLDSTVIGERETAKIDVEEQLTKERIRDIKTFTQQLSPATTGGTFEPGYFKQAEVGVAQRQVVDLARSSCRS